MSSTTERCSSRSSSAAIVDRVTFNAHILETGTESYRLAHARATRATT